VVLRSIKVVTACLGLVAVLTAAPIEFSSDTFLPGLHPAAAKPGNGRGKGHGKGHEPVAGETDALGFVSGQSNAGHANGPAIGHANNDAVSGVESAPPGQAKKAGYDGVAGTLGVKGSFNAIHSAAINKDLPPQSRVARVKAYLDAAQELSELENAPGGMNDLEAAIEAAALAAADASSQPVDVDMLDRVNAFSNQRGLTTPGIEVSPETQDEVARQAQEIQSGS
jgi:hypothetical protein